MSKHVLITGGLGYLGSVVAPYLIENGFAVTVLDTGYFKDSLLYPPTTEIPTVYKDARDVTAGDLDAIDAVVHFAGISNDPFGNLDAALIYDPTRAYAKKIAEMCKEHKVRFVFASSCSVYGKSDPRMASNEESATNPETAYSRNKLEVEEDLKSLADENFSPIALRFATVFGLSPRIRFDIVINMFVGMALTTGRIRLNSDGSSWRPNVHILDVAEAVQAALESDWDGGRLLILNVGDDSSNLPVIRIAEQVASVVGTCPIEFVRAFDSGADDKLIASAAVKDGKDTRSYRVSFDRIRERFSSFSCKRSIEEGVREMADGLRTMGLTKELFKDPKFYRLQTLERHLHEGRITSDLRWSRR
ncbi:MAG: SDR family oxidoreductase [Candidatus Vogelbacteria bacterium]|nr:SDR family oxidoreductase [Candidatus Vogelbacteria bacterium]